MQSMLAKKLTYDRFDGIPDEECNERILRAREILGERLLILGHHYQRDQVFNHADYTGDSLKLSRLAARTEADYIIFCGVHFMAETADILSRPDQFALLPDLSAGCSMADMADLDSVERCWQEIDKVLGDADECLTPITYINSAADLKAFCGRHDGIVCTSTNAGHIMEWALSRKQKVLFFPDQHLGRNTAYTKLGIPLEDMVVWDYAQPYGGLTKEQIKNARVILWKGFCSVHQLFRPEHIDAFRQRHPDGKVISHPESSFEVCQKSDYVGSTEYIIKTVTEAEAGTKWQVGTELNLVNRLQEQLRHENKFVEFMSPTLCMCSTMFRIDPQHLVWMLENLVDGQVVNQIKVPQRDTREARVALQRMLDVSS